MLVVLKGQKSQVMPTGVTDLKCQKSELVATGETDLEPRVEMSLTRYRA